MNKEYTTRGGKSYTSFLIRFWLIQRPSGEEELAIEVQSVQSGERLRFENFEAAVAFLRAQANEKMTRSGI